MPNRILTRKAALVQGALIGFVKPRLAVDAKLDWDSLLATITAKNYKDKKAGLLAAIEKQTRGKLAQDANIAGLAQLLDALEAEAPGEAGMPGLPETDPMTGAPGLQAPGADPSVPAMVGGGGPPSPPAAPGLEGGGLGEEDADDDLGGGGVDLEQLAAFLKSKGMQDADIAQACQLAGGGGGMGAEPEPAAPPPAPEQQAPAPAPKAAPPKAAPPGAPEESDNDDPPSEDEDDGSTGLGMHDVNKRVASDEPPEFTGMPKVGGAMDEEKRMVTKGAMDSAVKKAALEAVDQARNETKAAVKAAVEQERVRQHEIREAESVVRPWVGNLTMAYDSCDEIYRMALTTLGIKTEGIHPSAYRAILELQPLPGTRKRTNSHEVALDSAMGMNDFKARNPNASKIGIL